MNGETIEEVSPDLLHGIRRMKKPFIVDGVVIGLPFDLSQVVSKYGRSIIPDELGIYHLFYDDTLVYIGMSKSLRGRLLGHLTDDDMPFHFVLWFCGNGKSVREILDIERKMIKRFKPELNQTYCNY